MANEILAAILSFIIPGLGQVYAGDIRKGIIFIVIFFIFTILAYLVFNWVSIVATLFLIYSIYAAFDAYVLAKGL